MQHDSNTNICEQKPQLVVFLWVFCFLCAVGHSQKRCITDVSCWCRHLEAQTNEGSCTTSDSASTFNTASSYDYLKPFYEKVSDDPGGKNLTFFCKLHPPGFKKQIRTSVTSTANLKRHNELKHPELFRSVWVNKKSVFGSAGTAASPVPRLCSRPGFNSRPLSLCCVSLSPCFLLLSSAVLSIQKKYVGKKRHRNSESKQKLH